MRIPIRLTLGLWHLQQRLEEVLASQWITSGKRTGWLFLVLAGALVLFGHSGGWGSAASSVIAGSQLRILDGRQLGRDLLISPRGEAIYFHDTSAGGRATNLTSYSGANETPVVADQIIVSGRADGDCLWLQSRSGETVADPLMVRWCDREDLGEWEPTELTTAGGFPRLTLAQAHDRQKIRQGIATFTNQALYLIQFLGESGYAPRLISDNTTILGP